MVKKVCYLENIEQSVPDVRRESAIKCNYSAVEYNACFTVQVIELPIAV